MKCIFCSQIVWSTMCFWTTTHYDTRTFYLSLINFCNRSSGFGAIITVFWAVGVAVAHEMIKSTALANVTRIASTSFFTMFYLWKLRIEFVVTRFFWKTESLSVHCYLFNSLFKVILRINQAEKIQRDWWIGNRRVDFLLWWLKWFVIDLKSPFFLNKITDDDSWTRFFFYLFLNK